MEPTRPVEGPGLRGTEPTALEEARLTAHYAAQLLAIFGQNFASSEPDDSHRAMGWNADSGEFVSTGVDSATGSRAFFAPGSLTLRLARPDAGGGAVLDLEGRTLHEAVSWLREHLRPKGPELDLPEYDLPDHPLGTGAVFPAPIPELRQIEGWFAHAYRSLLELIQRPGNTYPIRIWPHHFDCAVLIPIPPAPEERAAGGGGSGRGTSETGANRSVGVGFSPGDGSYAQPYWYVSPWPYPMTSALPPLSRGHWHTEGWVGAILTARELLSQATPGEEGEVARAFLIAAHDAARESLLRG
jgi:hypothetical protein